MQHIYMISPQRFAVEAFRASQVSINGLGAPQDPPPLLCINHDTKQGFSFTYLCHELKSNMNSTSCVYTGCMHTLLFYFHHLFLSAAHHPRQAVGGQRYSGQRSLCFAGMRRWWLPWTHCHLDPVCSSTRPLFTIRVRSRSEMSQERKETIIPWVLVSQMSTWFSFILGIAVDCQGIEL